MLFPSSKVRLTNVEPAVTVGMYLLRAIKNLGVNKVFGIPGDMVIKFFTLLANDPELELYTFSHEPAVGFAAVGAARATRKPAVACVTYGPGALNMLNTVACAYAEKVPLIVISGGPAISARTDGFFWHHTVKNYQSQINIYKEVTQEAIILNNPATVAAKIKSVFTACQQYMLPVYIEIPADIVNQPIITSTQKPEPQETTKDEGGLKQAAAEVLDRIAKAQQPVFMAGVETTRYGLLDTVASLAKKLNIPLVSTMLARDFSPTDDSAFYGTYFGKAGNPSAEKAIAESDLVLLIGERLSDVTLGAKLARDKQSGIIQCFSHEVKTPSRTYKGVTLADLVAELYTADAARKSAAMPAKVPLRVNHAPKYTAEPIVSKEVIDAVNWFFGEHGEMPVISDTGNCLFMTLQIKATSIVGASFYGTMGLAVPAAIGYAVSTQKRPFVLVGDGAFQMTGQEICHCPRYGINPIFVVVNNRSWGMEQLFHASKFNELPNWSYAKMAELWGGKGYLCDTCEKFYKALGDAKQQKVFTLIEVVTARDELPEGLLAWVKEQKQGK